MTGLANYYFVPSLRQGLAAAIPEKDQDDNPVIFSERAHFGVDVAVNATGFAAAEVLQKEIELYGPGDIIGFDPRAIARTDPRRNVGDFEPNYFPMVEFATGPDFPWRYTAKQFASSNGNLQPWITLIVLIAEPVTTDAGVIDTEFEEGDRKLTNQNPFITVHKQTSLPDCNECMWWAHVQLTADESILGGGANPTPNHERLQEELDKAVRNNPERVVSRLLCTRRLRPGVRYNAFVVPTFELGRIATGLQGRDLDGNELNSTTYAWDHTSANPIDIPYYYKWEFRTGLRGDFEHLVRLLEARELPGLGTRKIDCSNPGYGLTSFTRVEAGIPSDHPDYRVTEMEGALKSIDTEYTPWGKDFIDANDDPHVFQTELADQLLNRPKADEETPSDEPPVVGPPVYGRWHRGRKPINSQYVRPGSQHTGWIDELNLDPRHRIVSGLGTEVVKRQQEELMAAAWDQLGAVDEANQQLRQAQLAREASICTEKRLKSLSVHDYIRSTSPLNSRVKDTTTGNTFAVTLRDSRIPNAVLDPAFRRIARRRGSIRKRQRFDGKPKPDILKRFNDETIRPAGPHPKPGGMVDMCELTDTLIESISFVNQPPVFNSTPPNSLPPGEFGYVIEVAAPEAGQAVDVTISTNPVDTTFPAELMTLEKINASQWRLTITMPAIPADGGDGGTTLPGGGVVVPGTGTGDGTTPGGGVVVTGGDVVDPGTGDPWHPEFIFYSLTLTATDNGTPPRTTLQKLNIQTTRGSSAWSISTDSESLPPEFPNFPSERRFCSKNITSSLLSNPDIINDLSNDDRTILNATKALVDGFMASDEPVASKPSMDFTAMKQTLEAALDPEVTIPKRTLRRINMQDIIRRGDICNRIMAGPKFPQPIYEPLRDISQDLLLPGLEKVPPNTISLLKTNSRFIESYMVGLNHEFSRELLWREYPTDQRGSYFRQFWDVAELVPTQLELDTLLENFLIQYSITRVADLPQNVKENILKRYRDRVGDYTQLTDQERDDVVTELLHEELLEEHYKDIKEIHTWRGSKLGVNKHRPGEDLVLIIRGDLLKRYPNTVIYAVEAVPTNNGDDSVQPNMPEFTGNNDPGLIKRPIFKGSLPPDVYFLGFDMSEQQAWGCDGSGWYFVLEERISEPRFGLDVPSDMVLDGDWDDLAWHHFGLETAFESYLTSTAPSNHVSGSFDTSDWNLNSSSSTISNIVLQKPIRIFIHAKQMLPKADCEG